MNHSLISTQLFLIIIQVFYSITPGDPSEFAKSSQNFFNSPFEENVDNPDNNNSFNEEYIKSQINDSNKINKYLIDKKQSSEQDIYININNNFNINFNTEKTDNFFSNNSTPTNKSKQIKPNITRYTDDLSLEDVDEEKNQY